MENIIIRNVEEKDIESIVNIQIDGWKTAYKGIIDDIILNSMNKEEKVERMKEVEMLANHFERELPSKEKQEEYHLKTILLELEISKQMDYRVYDEFESSEITKKEDGSFIVKVEYPENEWVYSYILSFGENIKVLAPAKAKEIIKCKLEKTLKNYL